MIEYQRAVCANCVHHYLEKDKYSNGDAPKDKCFYGCTLVYRRDYVTGRRISSYIGTLKACEGINFDGRCVNYEKKLDAVKLEQMPEDAEAKEQWTAPTLREYLQTLHADGLVNTSMFCACKIGKLMQDRAAHVGCPNDQCVVAYAHAPRTGLSGVTFDGSVMNTERPSVKEQAKQNNDVATEKE